MLHHDGNLVSSFFFSQNIASRNSTRNLITSIVRDIANRYPAFAADISRVLEDELSLASAPLARQYEALLWEPLQRHPLDKPVVIVIDSLDESSADGADSDLLGILEGIDHPLPPQLRIFVTSRPTTSIQKRLSGKPHVQWCLIDINSPESRQDITAYIDAQLRDDTILFKMGSAAQDRALVHELNVRAEGLFIWIATIFSYFRSAYNPGSKLRALLSNSATQGIPDADRKMDALYTAILDTCGAWDDLDFINDYQLVMGVIMAAERPLSLAVLRALCDDMQHLSPNLLLERFGSVLVGFKDENEPIRVLHLSFREFVTHRAGKSIETRKFCISKREHSRRLAIFCLKTISRELKSEAIAGTGYLESDKDSPFGIPKLHGISEQLLYACESLPHHIFDIGEPASIAPLIIHFLKQNHIRWLEIVASSGVFCGSLVIRRWLKVRFHVILDTQAPTYCFPGLRIGLSIFVQGQDTSANALLPRQAAIIRRSF